MLEFKAHFKSVQPDLGGSLPGNLIFGIPGKDGGYYLVAAEQVDANTIRFIFTPSQEEMPKVDPVEVDLPGATDEQIQKIVLEYLAQNPPTVEEKDPTVPDWAKQPIKPKYTAKEVGAVATVNGKTPDENGNVEITIPDSGGNVDLTGYAKEQWVQQNYQPKGEYLTAVPDGYAKTEDIPTKPEDIGAQPSGNYALKTEIPSIPVQSVNGKTGKVHLGAADVGARPSNWIPTAAEVGALPDTYVPPNQTAAQVGADPAGTAAAAVSAHNTSTDSHGDLRLALKAINDRLTAFFDSDNQTLDELSEIVTYITSNKSLIDSITTSKVSVADIINNLTTNVANKPLSAAQGVALKGLIDAVSNSLSNYQPKGDYALRSELPTVPTKVSQLENDKGYLTKHQDISGKLDADKLPEAVNTALAQAKESGEFDGGYYLVAAEQVDANTIRFTFTPSQEEMPKVDPVEVDLPGATDEQIQKIIEEYLQNNPAIGQPGKDGFSPIAKVTQTADGAVVTITDKDDTTEAFIANGRNGYTPQKGIDFWTPADQEAIVQQVIAALGTPVFGRVEDGNKIITTGNLASGTYEYWYEDENGKQVLIGTLDHNADAPNYTNQIPISTDTDGSIFNGTGYKASARLNSNCAVAEITNNPTNPAFVTGFIPIKQGDVIRLKNCYIDTKSYDSTTIYGNKTWALALCFYNSSFAWVDRCYWSEVSAGDKVSAVIGSDNLSTEFTVTCAKADIAYIRLTLAGTPGTAVVTVNEEIA